MTTPNFLVPEHLILSKEEKQKLSEKYDIKKFPKIRADDAALNGKKAKEGDVVAIKRISPITKEEAVVYRLVIAAD